MLNALARKIIQRMATRYDYDASYLLYLLGFASACQRVSVEGRWIDVAKRAA